MTQSSIKDIAQALGISIGTVDRALHGRARISSETRARVLAKVEQLGYRPNIAARSLKLNRRFRVGVYFPRHTASFFDPLRDGVRAAASETSGANVELVFRTFPRLGEGDVELLTADLDQKFDGNPTRIEPLLRKLDRKGVPIVCVADDCPRSKRLSSVSADAFTCGAVAAELFSRALHTSGHVAAITGTLAILDHSEKMRGFAETLAALAPSLTMLPPTESHGKPAEAYRQTKKLLARNPLPLGIYVSTANSLPVLRALSERGLLGKISLITADIFPELYPYIQSGQILATLNQRPFTQGKAALELLLRFLIHGIEPKLVNRFNPHIVMRSNLALFSKEEA